MQLRLSGIAVLVAIAASSLGVACSSTTAMGPPGPVSFSKDVMPIFHQSCTITTSCHGQPMNGGEANLYLGKNMNHDEGGGDNDAASIAMTYAGLFGKKSTENPTMDLVAAGKPANSYLFHKINDDQATLNGLGCKGGTCPAPDCDMTNVCGIWMPKSAGTTLDPSIIKTISDWISQGAPDN
jgi:hypothetical protein